MSILIQNESCETDTFSQHENLMWAKLYKKQINNIRDKATSVFLKNIEKLALPNDRIPNFSDISKRLREATGWQVVPVNGLIGYEPYFKLLANCQFPSTTFIRSADQENLSKDPDVFHEIFGHCTMLLSSDYANFMQEFAKFALTVKPIDRPLFSRLIWFTTETGLINTQNGIKIYGSSIISSYEEANYCLQKNDCIHKPFDLINVFREPFRADLLQKVYYVINDYNEIYNLVNTTDELYKAIQIARELQEFPALFPVEHNKYTNIGYCFPIENGVKIT